MIKSLKLGQTRTLKITAASFVPALDKVLKYYSPKLQELIKAAYPILEQAETDGVIQSKLANSLIAVLKKASEHTRKITNKATKKIGKPRTDGSLSDKKSKKGFEYGGPFYDLNFVLDGTVYEAVNDPKEFVRDHEKLLAPLTKAYPEYGAGLGELLSMAKDFIPVAEMIIKLEGMKTNKTIERFKPNRAKIESMKTLYDLLTKLIADTRSEMIAYWNKTLIENAQSFVAFTKTKAITGKDLKGVELSLIDYDHSPMAGYHDFKLLDGYQAKAKQMAESIADETQQDFLGKSVSKLASIVEKRGDYSSAHKQNLKFYNGRIEGNVKVDFANGDTFTVLIQVVFVTNQQGTHFTRYPLTFHDVKFGDKTFKKVTEEWMNTVFSAPQV